jgi:hypothetical protein
MQLLIGLSRVLVYLLDSWSCLRSRIEVHLHFEVARADRTTLDCACCAGVAAPTMESPASDLGCGRRSRVEPQAMDLSGARRAPRSDGAVSFPPLKLERAVL